MAFVLIFIGALLFVTAIRGTSLQFVQMLQQDVFTNQNGGSYLYWAVAIFLVGALGYIKQVRPLSDSFLLLLIIVLFLANGGVFRQFNAALGQTASGGNTNEGTSLQLNSVVNAYG